MVAVAVCLFCTCYMLGVSVLILTTKNQLDQEEIYLQQSESYMLLCIGPMHACARLLSV